ncbi:hypothetical protein ZIOFF_053027 [Zingiber officinale]|uniref:SGNH hydrolase-type esterase domain-containing protein n=1 Tax=Zingiber officinale TaxID=94328 RepID=A0A8J5FBV1_ZINOF|nr:hypothetical protein ZIOFF_053027 [Zingiber officinale]
MVGPGRPLFVLFGSSIVQFSFSNGGWGAILADVYARKVLDLLTPSFRSAMPPMQALVELLPEVQSAVSSMRDWQTVHSSGHLAGLKDAAVQPSLVIVYFGGNDSMGSHSSGLGPHVPLPEYIENMRKIGTHLKNLSEKTRIIFLTNPPVNEELIHRTQSDGIHLSSEGSKILVAEIIKILKEAVWKPSLYWKSMPTEFSEDSPYDVVALNGVSTINISNLTTHREIQWD